MKRNGRLKKGSSASKKSRLPRGAVDKTFYKVFYEYTTNWGVEEGQSAYFPKTPQGRKDAQSFALKMAKDARESAMDSDDYEGVKIVDETGKDIESWTANLGEFTHYPEKGKIDTEDLRK